MKTHYAEDNDDVTSAVDTADDHCWRDHQIKKSSLVWDIAIALTLLAGVVVTGPLWTTPHTTRDAAASAQIPIPTFVNRAGSPRSLLADVDDR